MSATLYESPRQEFSQGDILDNVPHIFLQSPHERPAENRVVNARGILLTHDCQIDKQGVLRWSIAPVTPLHKLPKGQQGDTIRNRIFSRFFLPRYGSLAEDSFVEFEQISTVDREIIKASTRVTSLSDEGRRGLYGQFIRFITRWELRSVACPNCGAEVNASDTLPVRAE